ncbi:MAG: hypothetical protein L0220_09530 [Acidobacteria bacterium]|nr:hypothetical protein [Acidobacteriota bacterium]
MQTVNLLTKAQELGFTSSVDPDIAKLLADIRNSTTNTGGIQQLNDPNLQRFTFANSSNGIRYYPTIRLDFNLTENHHLESIYLSELPHHDRHA